MFDEKFFGWYGMIILVVWCVGKVVVVGDGQVSVGQMVMKGMVCKVCCLLFGGSDVVVGFVGLIVDVFILLEWLEWKLELVLG